MNTSTSTTMAVRAVLAAELGEDAANINVLQWGSTLMQRGVIINLRIGRWRATKKLRANAVGLRGWSESEKKWAHLGQELLLSPDIVKLLNSIETRARQILEKSSIDTVWGRFVPAGRYQEFRDEIAEKRDEYLAIRDDIVLRYDEILQEVRLSKFQQARRAWRRVQGYDPDDELISVDEHEVTDYVEQILVVIPAAQEIHDSFYFDVIPTMIPLPSMLQADIDAARDAAQTAELERERRWAADHQAQEMEREVQEYWVARKREEIDAFVTATVANLRSEVLRVVTKLGDALVARDGKIAAKQQEMFTNLVAWTRQMDNYGDREVSAALASIQQEMAQPEANRVALETKLNALGAILEQSLGELGVTRGTRVTETALVEQVTETDIVRQARRTLGIEQVAELPVVRRKR